ncbi:MAG TPA: type II and III secretion system protein [Sedimentisphaerales bacterium]|nr:type II and III secretion system protein [Sedimentisphaerales bacterium]
MKNTVRQARDYNDGYRIMTSSSQNVNRSQCLSMAMTVAVVLLVGGCGDFLSGKTTGLQSQSIIRDVSRIEPVSDPNISVPEIYKEPPKIIEQKVGGTPEFKLFYFCMYHTSDELKKIVHEQFATKLFTAEPDPKVTTVTDYTVSSNPATNQLILRCPTREDATAVLELLEMVDVPPIQVKIDCLISEVYADLTLDWETTLEIENLFGAGIRAGSSAQPFGTGVTELVEEGSLLPAFPGASLRDLARTQMGLQIGYLSDSGSFLAMVDLLESKGYLKILMNPTLEVINGKTAKISQSQHVPLQRITKTIPGTGATTVIVTETEYVDVVDSLEITPHVFADGYIGLETSILLGSKLTPEGVKQLPIVTKKEIENKENRIRKGESLVIGGIRKTEERDVARGVPFLKDIPVLGLLFSGRDFEERVVETIFILTPTISTGGIPNKEMVEKVKRKHRTPISDGLDEIIKDPFGFEAGEKARQLETSETERIRLDAEAEKAQNRYALREAVERVKRAEAELNKVKAEADAALKAAEEAEKAKKEDEEK